ncbi:MAG: hypothetical protein JSR76_02385 [Verrucomicrobia bacterium]|nr:hypothetical protein [Verrucomicrobiota bacterium]
MYEKVMAWISTLLTIIPLIYTSVEVQKISGLWEADVARPPPEVEMGSARMEKTLQEVSGDGSKLTMVDGTTWEIALEDRSVASGWIAGAAPVVIESSGNAIYPYTITNKWTKSAVHARPWQPPSQNRGAYPNNTAPTNKPMSPNNPKNPSY